MEKLKTFISLFVCLSDAGHSVSGIRLPEQYQSAIKKRIGNLVSDFENDRISITSVIEEIESSISHTNNPKAVILRVLRKFQDISPYLLINLKKEYSVKNDEEVLKIGNATYYKSYVLSHKTLERYCAWIQPLLDYTDANIYEKYLIQSFLSFVDFFNAFDMLCLDYGFDVIKIQEENGIIVWVRNIYLLTANGYHAKVKPIKSFPYQFPEQRERDIEPLPPQPIKTKADILKEQLSQYGFFELEKVKTLSEQSKVSIIEKIAESSLPYAIAMFDYLQFIPYLEKKHFDSKYKLNREVSKWFDSDKEGRAVKGNISSLLKNTTENKDRYTAYKHKENVIKDYELLK